MTVLQWLGVGLTLLLLTLLTAAGFAAIFRGRRLKSPPREGWLTDEMVDEIIKYGTLASGRVPDESLDLEEISREEERFWSETWDESEPYWE